MILSSTISLPPPYSWFSRVSDTLRRPQLWCWIASQWNALRIYSYYLPIWVCSVLSAVIYFAVGYHVFHQRNQLRNLSLSNQGKDNTTGDSSDVRDSAEKVCHMYFLAYRCSQRASSSSAGQRVCPLDECGILFYMDRLSSLQPLLKMIRQLQLDGSLRP